MTTDRELLELAAKAAGIAVLRSCLDDPARKYLLLVEKTDDDRAIGWNPLTDDGDALRLATKLQISINMNIVRVEVSTIGLVLAGIFIKEDSLAQDVSVAARRAIVRAAAEISRLKA